MKILVVGSGGREHALCWALAASPLASIVYCAPGNAGIATTATRVDIGIDDQDGLCRFAQENAIDLVVPGPEGPLVQGLVDAMTAIGIKTFGPSAQAARLEGSKCWMKDFCQRHQIPTAKSLSFDDIDAAWRYIDRQSGPLVIKADGLAAGKGVFICPNPGQARQAAQDLLGARTLGPAGQKIVIEDYIDGQELSVFALSDGEHVIPLAAARDHKRAFDGDKGPNTGGMGAFSTPELWPENRRAQIMETIINPTIQGMIADGCPFRGVLFAGLMIQDNQPVVLEYNIRFGDPECQAILPRLQSDLLTLMLAGCDQSLHRCSAEWYDFSTLCLVLATKGYPGAYDKGSIIDGLDRLTDNPDILAFHSGTAIKDGYLTAQSGRVLGLTGKGSTLAQARQHAYSAANAIDWPQGFYRRDIGL